jgi:hypothetical protein
MTGCTVLALDGDIGHVADLLIDVDSWRICYLVLDTRNWLPGRRVVLSPRWIKHIDWVTGRMKIDLNRETVKSSPPYEQARPITPDYSARLQRHYLSHLPALREEGDRAFLRQGRGQVRAPCP